SEIGQAQARALVKKLNRLDLGPLFSSPYRRAIDTLAPFAAATSQPITLLPDLRERLLSPNPLPDWQDHIRASFDNAHHAPEGGESHADLLKRWSDALSIIGKAAGRPAFATHGGMTAALLHAQDPTFGFEGWASLRNPDLFEVEITQGQLTAVRNLTLEEL
ncbi:MAG: histidine phosphatase family protein, partial [Pseudomonadota bacterium]